ncbi:MAG: phage tail protein [Cyanobacteria bacterium J06638_7]
MAGTLYQIGSFQFNLTDGSPDELSRDMQWAWPQQGRILRKPALQFLGPGSDRITLNGVLYPGTTGNQGTIDTLRQLADSGEPQTLVDGLGRVYGRFAILNVRERRQVFLDTGAARRIEFELTLLEYGEDGSQARPSTARINNPSLVEQLLGSVEDVSFDGEGSGFALTDWTRLPDFGDDLGSLQVAGFSSPQAALVGQVVGDPAQVRPSLDAFGAGGALSGAQGDAWESIGVSPSGLLQAASSGLSPYATGISVDRLRTAGEGVINQVAGSAVNGVTSMLGASSTLGPLLSPDPGVASTVRGMLGF